MKHNYTKGMGANQYSAHVCRQYVDSYRLWQHRGQDLIKAHPWYSRVIPNDALCMDYQSAMTWHYFSTFCKRKLESTRGKRLS